MNDERRSTSRVAALADHAAAVIVVATAFLVGVYLSEREVPADPVLRNAMAVAVMLLIISAAVVGRLAIARMPTRRGGRLSSE